MEESTNIREQIRLHLNDAGILEKMYRQNKAEFRREFNALYPEIQGNPLAGVWHTRLNYKPDKIEKASAQEITLVIAGALFAGIIAKLPALFPIKEEFFYSRNLGFIIFPVLCFYFAWKNKLPIGNIITLSGSAIGAVLYINLLPEGEYDTLILSCMHLVLFLWFLLGYAFVGKNKKVIERRLDFLKFNGDLLVISALLVIAGAMMSGITVGLFSVIGLNIEKFYFQYIAVFGVAAVPVVGTYLIQRNPRLVGKISPVIARIFSPLVLVMLVIYLAAMAYAGKDPYNDRDFLLVFNALLVGVMVILFFSVADTVRSGRSRAEIWVLMLLSAVTIIVNGIAVSAILFRISEWGFTPNRTAVLGTNILILVHLILCAVQLGKVLSNKKPLEEVGRSIALYLPVYLPWIMVVTFLFPAIFGFR